MPLAIDQRTCAVALSGFDPSASGRLPGHSARRQ